MIICLDDEAVTPTAEVKGEEAPKPTNDQPTTSQGLI